MNTSQLIAKYKSGEKMSDTEVTKLYEDLKSVEEELIGKGDMFFSSRLLATTMLERVVNVMWERNLTSKEE